MKFSKVAIAAFATVAMASAAQATVYNVNFSVGGGGVTGTITTNGALGVLSTGNITSWALTLNDGSSTLAINPGNSGDVVLGSAFTATAGGLFFNFGLANGSAVDFQAPSVGSGVDYWCFNTTGIACSGSGPNPGMVLKLTGNELSQGFGGLEQIASAGGVPEPATWALMLGGFGLAGVALRRKALAAA